MNVGFFIVLAYLFYVAVVSYLRIKNTSGYYLANREAPAYLIVGSLMASTVSGGMFFGMVAYYYNLGAAVFWMNLGVAWSWIIICYFIGPKLRRFGQFTIPEYLAQRFDSPSLRVVFSIITTLWMVVLMGSVLVQGGLLFEYMYGVDYATAIVVIGVAVGLYTVFGGMFAVLKTDWISMWILLAGAFVALPYLLKTGGGWSNIVDTIYTIQPAFFTSLGGRTTFFTAASWFFIWCFGYLGHPGFLTRFYTAKNVREVIKSGIGVSLLYMPLWVLIFFISTSLRAIYPTIGDPELVWITFMFEHVPPIVVGFAMAAVLAAVLSSANTWLLTAATSVCKDIYQCAFDKNVSDKKLLTISKVAVMVLSLIAIPIGIWRPTYIMELMMIAYLIAGSSGGLVILLSMYYKNMTTQAAWAGIISGALIATVWRTLQLVGTISSAINPIIPTILVALAIIIIVSKATKPTEATLAMFNKLNDKSQDYA